MRNLILTICSNHKSDKGQKKQYDTKAHKMADDLSHDMREMLYGARKMAFRHLNNPKRTGRFPAGRPQNKAVRGPDINPDSKELDGFYLPALKRYDGRFYKEFKSAAGHVDRCIRRMKNDSENHILIVSGMYGLLTPTESIQKYSCDVTDEPRVKRLWKKDGLLTELVLSYMRKWSINRVFDFMADDSYRHLIDWELIKENDGKIFYSRCGHQTGPDMLPELGKATGILLSGKTTQQLSNMNYGKVKSTNVVLVRKQPNWVPADSTFSDRETCIVWAIRMESNIRHFLDCYFINKKPSRDDEYTSAKIERFRNMLPLDIRERNICNIMDEIRVFRNDVVHNYSDVDDARKQRETRIDKTAPQASARMPNDRKVEEIRTCYKETLRSAAVYAKKNRKVFSEPEDVDY